MCVLPFKETDKMSELTETQIESSDDELPEEVAFDASKSAALKSVKDALEAAKREKILLKEKRKKRQQLFQEQKKRKRLPQELLEEFDKEPQKQTGPSDNKCINKKVSTKPSDINKDKTKTGNMPKRISKSLPDSYTVMRIKDESAAKSLQQKAMDFIQSRLYGPGTKRTTNAELLSLKKKRGASKGAAVEFVNKKLGASQKARIARSNKRFIRQQKLIPF
ncbi:nucleolar protein 7-like [Sinocyclocheilus grahami]|uniref:nucleolar protein 7-like n=1 Tax=Sinocyclocheilus grahami TaxID=75366 RepID=UPI0007AC88D4|nr:PREDICTED: nucleolar protein 7-like [Sinocyclocheilus grahami]